jgi:hypothetical protein
MIGECIRPLAPLEEAVDLGLFDPVTPMCFQCVLCKDPALPFTLLAPCGHQTCQECAEDSSRCPECDQPILFRTRSAALTQHITATTRFKCKKRGCEFVANNMEAALRHSHKSSVANILSQKGGYEGHGRPCHVFWDLDSIWPQDFWCTGATLWEYVQEQLHASSNASYGITSITVYYSNARSRSVAETFWRMDVLVVGSSDRETLLDCFSADMHDLVFASPPASTSDEDVVLISNDDTFNSMKYIFKQQPKLRVHIVARTQGSSDLLSQLSIDSASFIDLPSTIFPSRLVQQVPCITVDDHKVPVSFIVRTNALIDSLSTGLSMRSCREKHDAANCRGAHFVEYTPVQAEMVRTRLLYPNMGLHSALGNPTFEAQWCRESACHDITLCHGMHALICT